MNTLSKQDAMLFYQLWFPLLNYAKDKKKISTSVKQFAMFQPQDPHELLKTADAVWSDTKLIDSYLEQNKQLPEEYKEIMRSWKRRVRGTFVMERHLKDGSIFINTKDQKVYQVRGLIQSWQDMLSMAPMPLMMDAVLIPFKDVIISDGLISYKPIQFSSNMKKMLKETYMNAKTEGSIICSLGRNTLEAYNMESLNEYDKKVEKNEKRNEEFLTLFSDDLKNAGLAEKTIRNHVNNAGFYLNAYLPHWDEMTMEDGASGYYLEDFFGYFFIRKCMWSTPYTIKTTAASLKKFYKCMRKHGKITQEQYEDVADTIKYSMEEWQEECAEFNDI